MGSGAEAAAGLLQGGGTRAAGYAAAAGGGGSGGGGGEHDLSSGGSVGSLGAAGGAYDVGVVGGGGGGAAAGAGAGSSAPLSQRAPQFLSLVAERLNERGGHKRVIDAQQAELEALQEQREALVARGKASKARIAALQFTLGVYKATIERMAREVEAARRNQRDVERHLALILAANSKGSLLKEVATTFAAPAPSASAAELRELDALRVEVAALREVSMSFAGGGGGGAGGGGGSSSSAAAEDERELSLAEAATGLQLEPARAPQHAAFAPHGRFGLANARAQAGARAAHDLLLSGDVSNAHSGDEERESGEREFEREHERGRYGDVRGRDDRGDDAALHEAGAGAHALAPLALTHTHLAHAPYLHARAALPHSLPPVQAVAEAAPVASAPRSKAPSAARLQALPAAGAVGAVPVRRV